MNTLGSAGARTVLHVGCGPRGAGSLHPLFERGGWRELRLDIDPAVEPDIVSSMTDMGAVPSHSVSAIYSSHNLEHLYPHEVPVVLAEFRRVLGADGVALITLPDLQSVAERVAADQLEEPAYISPAGPIAPHDILYGFRARMAMGNLFMAHRTGFTARSLRDALERAGFARVLVGRDARAFALWAVAFTVEPAAETAAEWRAGAIPATAILLPSGLPGGALSSPPVLAPPPPETAAEVMSRVFALALVGQLPASDLFTVSDRLCVAGNHALAAMLYRSWLEHRSSPAFDHLVRYNFGVVLSALGETQEAVASFEQALALFPSFDHARFGLGLELERLNRVDEAIGQWRQVLAGLETPAPESSSSELAPSALAPEREALRVSVLNNLGRVLEIGKHYQEAEALLARSLALRPGQDAVIQHWLRLRQKQCEWPIYGNAEGAEREALEHSIAPLALLSVFDDPARQLAAARHFVATRIKSGMGPLAERRDYGHSRLRIGYLSSDFCLHPVAMLVAELLELHDRTRVEVYGFCWSHEDGSELRRRVLQALDHHIPLGALSDEAAARRIRALEIDVLVDLHGLTSGVRPEILSWRPAPFQVTYLGFPGTTALPGIDAVIADDFVLPPELEPYFAESPIRIAPVFQVSDRRRPIGPRPERAACGLPEDGVVFCCFNNSFKFTPELFPVWMRILHRTPGSVLWLLADNEWQQVHLIAEAARLGIGSERLIFVGRTGPETYLARYRTADLFLDTFPFNGGTTANDALWMGLPILTCAGQTFASRMAGSLLRTVGLPELITSDFNAYEEKAVALAHDRPALAALRRHLEETRATSPLFDVSRLVREIEEAFFNRIRAGFEAGSPR